MKAVEQGTLRRGWLAGGCLAVLVSLLMLGPWSGEARGAIAIYESSEAATLLGKVKKAKCKLVRNGEGFRAKGKSTNGVYEFEVEIFQFNGFKRFINVQLGSINPTVNVEGAGQDYSNNWPVPGGQVPPSAGGIGFRKRGAKLRAGIFTLPNPDYSRGVVLAGGLNCIYGRR